MKAGVKKGQKRGRKGEEIVRDREKRLNLKMRESCYY